MQRQGRESWSRSRLPLSLSRGLALGFWGVVRRKLPVTVGYYARRFCKKMGFLGQAVLLPRSGLQIR